jgi:hypothetical protein
MLLLEIMVKWCTGKAQPVSGSADSNLSVSLVSCYRFREKYTETHITTKSAPNKTNLQNAIFTVSACKESTTQ